MTTARMIVRLEEAAKALHPILLGDDKAHSAAAHDALNALAAVRLGLELREESLPEALRSSH